jgi:hypothetical protein
MSMNIIRSQDVVTEDVTVVVFFSFFFFCRLMVTICKGISGKLG